MASQKRLPMTAKLAGWRGWFQTAFLLAWLDPFSWRFHYLCSPVFHCHSCPLAVLACPIGVLANFSALHVFPFLAVGTLAVTGVVFGTFVCGWACPFGFLQDLVGRIPTPKVRLPSWLGYTRYATLGGLVLAVPYFYGENHPLFFCRLCPAGAIEAAVPFTASLAIRGEQMVWPSAAKLSILLIVVVAMLFTWRPWCLLLCPLGAIYGLCNRVSVLALRFRADRCNDCDLCRLLCNYRGLGERRGKETNCLRCLDCTQCTAITVTTAFRGNAAPACEETAPAPDSEAPTGGTDEHGK